MRKSRAKKFYRTKSGIYGSSRFSVGRGRNHRVIFPKSGPYKGIGVGYYNGKLKRKK